MSVRAVAPHSLVRHTVLPDAKQVTMQAVVRKHVKPGSRLFTDGHTGYAGLAAEYLHEVVDHMTEYVRGRVHTNGLENFWSLVKRALHGTYVSVEPSHVTRYLDEQAFRFNNRGKDDAGRFLRLAGQIVGRRITYDALTGAKAWQT